MGLASSTSTKFGEGPCHPPPQEVLSASVAVIFSINPNFQLARRIGAASRPGWECVEPTWLTCKLALGAPYCLTLGDACAIACSWHGPRIREGYEVRGRAF